MSFAIGSLVRARGREWVVLPESDEDLIVVRPLGGTDEEVAGIHTGLEEVVPAQFDLPNPQDPSEIGDHLSCRLLRDAVRISSRAGAGPFRSFGHIAVDPRPYQLVPLLMALRLDPIRMLIADDVGIGKTVEAALIAREMLDRGEVGRIAVLCPPHLAEQWQAELADKFHIDAELVLSSTAARLERHCRLSESLFDHYPHVVVSMDFIKSEARRTEFSNHCPELVIVDEAHTCAFGAFGRGGRQLRHELIGKLAEDPERHVVMVTATPHSGKEEAFRSLLSFLDPDFSKLPDDLTGKTNEGHRRRLAQHFVQRRRADIRKYLDEDTPFPERLESEQTYSLSKPYKALFDRVLAYARETVQDENGGQHRQRVRWWSALALLRSLASSPAAAAATLRNRAATVATATAKEADEVGRKTVFDDAVDDLDEAIDVAPGADASEAKDDVSARGPKDRRLIELAREAEKLGGKNDKKLTEATKHVSELLTGGFHPIVFCRFIPTVDYVAAHLRKKLPKGTEVVSVTGQLAPKEREARIEELGALQAEGKQGVLVCTDCLSEGINLQEHFDAVVHYDLAWNPTRHEQREGRVDRFGQPKPEVRVLTLYGTDNGIDGIVLDVLLRKHRSIRNALGISVPVPIDTNQVVEAIFEGLLLREQGGESTTDFLPGLEEYMKPQKQQLHDEWQNAADRETRSRTVFAQETIKVADVAGELEAARAATGAAQDVRRFTIAGLRAHGAAVDEKKTRFEVDLRGAPRALRDNFAHVPDRFQARFELPISDGVLYLARTHPLVEGLASHVMDTALDPALEGAGRRAGAIRTAAVTKRTTLMLCRFRFDITTRQGSGKVAAEQTQLAEECGLVAFEGAPDHATWLTCEQAEQLLEAQPDGEVLAEQKVDRVQQVVSAFEQLRPALENEAAQRGEALLDSHRRVRQAARIKGLTYRVEPQLPVDVLGIYVYLPVPKSGGGTR